MQTTFKNHSKLRGGARSSHLALSPQMGKEPAAACIVGFLTVEEPLERVVAASIAMTPAEARDLATRLIAAADAADTMLATTETDR